MGDIQRLKETEKVIIRWIRHATQKGRTTSEELRPRWGLVSVPDRVCPGRLKWFGCVEG